jgi:predicted nuclease of predicted toxin-antitoxin system
VRFLVDAHLPPRLCLSPHAAGHDAIHTHQLPDRNSTTDQRIINYCDVESRVLITKDSDFYYSHVLYRRPSRVLLIRTGNMRGRELVALIERQLPQIVGALDTSSLVELERASVRPARPFE